MRRPFSAIRDREGSPERRDARRGSVRYHSPAVKRVPCSNGPGAASAKTQACWRVVGLVPIAGAAGSWMSQDVATSITRMASRAALATSGSLLPTKG